MIHTCFLQNGVYQKLNSTSIVMEKFTQLGVTLYNQNMQYIYSIFEFGSSQIYKMENSDF